MREPNKCDLFPASEPNGREFRKKLLLENVTLGRWASRLLHTKPQDQTNWPPGQLQAELDIDCTRPSETQMGTGHVKLTFKEAKENVCIPQSGLHTRERGKKGWRHPFPIPYPKFTSQNSKGQSSPTRKEMGKNFHSTPPQFSI